MTTDVDLRQLVIDRGEPQPATGMPRRRHLLTRYALPVLLLGGFAGLVGWASWETLFPPRPVTVVPVVISHEQAQPQGTPLFKAAGWIEPRPTAVRVAALAPGVVEQLLVVEDQPVEAGEAVAELVKDDARLARDRALADVKLRESELAEAQAALRAAATRLKQPVHLTAPLGEAEAALAKAETQLANLPFELRRAEARLDFAHKDHAGKLAAVGAVSGRAIDQAQSEVEAARALVEELRRRAALLEAEQTAAERRRDALQTQLELLADELKARDETQAKVQSALARLEQTRVALAEAQLRLDRMTVRAPTAGRVYQLLGLPGTTLAGGMSPEGPPASTVVTLYRPEMLQVRVDVRFEDVPKVAMHQPVEIDNPALDDVLTGHVLFISSVADIQKNTLQVKVGIGAAPSVLKPDMLVDVTFLAPQPPESGDEPSDEMRLYVPHQLVHQDEGGKFVWLADQSARVARRAPVDTGAGGAAGLIEVTRGLTITSRLIAGDGNGLADGSRIRVTGEERSLATDDRAARPRKYLERLPVGGNH